MITQELEILEKENIFDIKSVTIEYPRTVTKLSELIKQAEIIIQQPKENQLILHYN